MARSRDEGITVQIHGFGKAAFPRRPAVPRLLGDQRRDRQVVQKKA